MLKGVNIICVIALLVLKVTASPPLLPHAKCLLQDSACLTAQARLVLKSFVKGLPELGINMLDKVSIDSILIKKDGFNFEANNIAAEGLKNTVIDKVCIDMDIHILKLSFRTTLKITGNYTAEGVLFTFPVHGRGGLTVIHREVNFEMIMLFDIIKKNENDFMDLKNYRFGFDTVGDTHFKFENLVNNDEKRNEKVNAVLNEYWRTATGHFGYNPLKSVMDKIFDAVKIYIGSYALNDIATLN